MRSRVRAVGVVSFARRIHPPRLRNRITFAECDLGDLESPVPRLQHHGCCACTADVLPLA